MNKISFTKIKPYLGVAALIVGPVLIFFGITSYFHGGQYEDKAGDVFKGFTFTILGAALLIYSWLASKASSKASEEQHTTHSITNIFLQILKAAWHNAKYSKIIIALTIVVFFVINLNDVSEDNIFGIPWVSVIIWIRIILVGSLVIRTARVYNRTYKNIEDNN